MTSPFVRQPTTRTVVLQERGLFGVANSSVSRHPTPDGYFSFAADLGGSTRKPGIHNLAVGRSEERLPAGSPEKGLETELRHADTIVVRFGNRAHPYRFGERNLREDIRSVNERAELLAEDFCVASVIGRPGFHSVDEAIETTSTGAAFLSHRRAEANLVAAERIVSKSAADAAGVTLRHGWLHFTEMRVLIKMARRDGRAAGFDINLAYAMTARWDMVLTRLGHQGIELVPTGRRLAECLSPVFATREFHDRQMAVFDDVTLSTARGMDMLRLAMDRQREHLSILSAHSFVGSAG
jgi:hypothetical protein